MEVLTGYVYWSFVQLTFWIDSLASVSSPLTGEHLNSAKPFTAGRLLWTTCPTSLDDIWAHHSWNFNNIYPSPWWPIYWKVSLCFEKWKQIIYAGAVACLWLILAKFLSNFTGLTPIPKEWLTPFSLKYHSFNLIITTLWFYRRSVRSLHSELIF